MSESRRTYCGLCHPRCGLLLEIESGRAIRVKGDAEMEFNEALPSEQRAKQLGADEYPFFGFPGWERNEEANRSLM